ncbi:MAG: LOG family protein [Candidatus Dependentiae bacterium]
MKISCVKHGSYLFFNAIKLGFQMMRGACMLAKVRMPIITIFGGQQAKENSVYYKQAYELSKRLAEHSISTVTGGGPGIMFAASCGSKDGKQNDDKLNTLGIAVHGVDDDFENKCSPVFWVNYFFIRKWLMVRYSLGIVVFPGGVGTVDELFDVLNYMKHKRVPPIPLVLVGIDYWQPLIDWMEHKAIAQGYMKKYYLDFFILVDTADEAFAIVHRVCDQYKDHIAK